jgi:hypothetical protein
MIFQHYRDLPAVSPEKRLTSKGHAGISYFPTCCLRGLTLFSLVLWMHLNAFAQNSGISQDQLRALASGSFNSHHYKEAGRYYSMLLDIFPRDPKYHYYTAVSLINSNSDFTRAIELLHFQPIAQQYPDASFQLGEAYRRMYSFDEAEKQFKTIIDTKDIDKIIRDRARNSLQMNAEARSKVLECYNVLTYDRMEWTSLQTELSFSSGEKLIGFTPVDQIAIRNFKLLADSGSVIVNSSIEGGQEYIYFPARKGKKEDLNIYKARKTGSSSIGVPLLLDFSVNSNLDESFAWFDTLDSSLYFSSQAHGSMGGLDIFVCRWEQSRMGFSQPKALGFPVNSAADDFGFVILPDRKSAVLLSNRLNGGPGYTAFHIQWPVRLKEGDPPVSDSLLAFSMLLGKVNLNHLPKKEKPIPKSENELNLHPAENKKLNESPGTSGDGDADYMSLLNEALQLQLQADSILRLTEEYRTRLGNPVDSQEKQRLQQEVRRLAGTGDQIQAQANKKYSQAREMELNYLHQVYQSGSTNSNPGRGQEKGVTTSPNKDGTKVTSVNNTVNGSLSTDKGEVSSNTKVTELKVRSATNLQTTPSDLFEIMPSCPYSDRNPVPAISHPFQGVVYRIQLGVFSKPVAADMYRGLSPLVTEKVPENGLTRFYVGLFGSIGSAEKSLQKVKEYGYKEAYLVSFFQGKRISLIRARELEQMIRSGGPE